MCLSPCRNACPCRKHMTPAVVRTQSIRSCGIFFLRPERAAIVFSLLSFLPTVPSAPGRKYRGSVGGVWHPPPILKIADFAGQSEDFAGRQEELYCHTETPPLKFVKGRLRILKWKYYICYKPPFLTLHFRERNRYVRKSSVICKAKACLTESHSQWMQWLTHKFMRARLSPRKLI